MMKTIGITGGLGRKIEDFSIYSDTLQLPDFAGG